MSPKKQTPTPLAAQQLDFLNNSETLNEIRGIARGIEKEGLRTRLVDNSIAATPHPAALGSPLTNSWVTTDFSEALLEFITPVNRSINETLNYLSDIHAFAALNMEEEFIWNASMPCKLPADDKILSLIHI